MNRQQTTRHLIERAQDAAESELYSSDLCAEMSDHLAALQALVDGVTEIVERWEDGAIVDEDAMRVMREVMRE